MIPASRSLLDYAERYDLDTSNACRCFISGFAAYMAVHSWLDWFENDQKRSLPGGVEILTRAAGPSETAIRKAYFHAGMMVARDTDYAHPGSLAVVLAAAWRRMWPEEDRDDWLGGTWALELGWYIAAEASGSGASWEDDFPPHGLNPASAELLDEDYFAKPDES